MKYSALGLLAAALLPGAESAVTVYHDRDEYLDALGNANIVEATARRSPNVNFWAQNIRIQYRDFEQCGLSFGWGGEKDHMNFIQTRYGEHGGNRNKNGDKSFKGGAVWWLWLKKTTHDGYKIKTDYPFYAMGFDYAGGGPGWGIKILGEDVQYYDSPPVHRGAPAKFVGWISDGEPVSEFEIVGHPSRSSIHAMAFTNVAYATPDDDAITSVGCYNKNPASRSCWATGWGDPHLITWDGLKYDVHAKGEVVMTRSLDSDFEIQARLTGLSKSSTAGPAVTTGIAVRDPGFPTLQVNVADANSATAEDLGGCPIDLFVDGAPTSLTSWEGSQGARVLTNEDADKVIIEYVESNIRIDMRLKKYSDTCLFSVDYFLADCYNNENLIGLLGSPDGDWTNDWMTQNDTVIPLPDGVEKFFFEPAYNYSVDNWCTRTPEETIFSYEGDKDFFDYAKCGNAYDPSMEEILKNVPKELEFCKGDFGCLIDGEFVGEEAAEDYIDEPALKRTKEPTPAPTPAPTLATPAPTSGPTNGPTGGPTGGPTSPPTSGPTEAPVATTLGLTENGNLFDDIDDVENSRSNPNDSLIIGDTFNSRDPAGSNGDPHFKTWRNEHYEFHGQCDMVLTRDNDFANGLGLEVQIRTKLVRFWSYIETAAIRIGEDILEISGTGDHSDRNINYWFNFQHQNDVTTTTIGGFPLKISYNKVHKRFYEIDLSSKYPGQKIVLSTFKEFVAVDFKGTTAEAFGNTVGMLGNYKTGKTLARDGFRTLDDFTELGNEWQVLPSDNMLFHDIAEPQFPKKCIVPEDPRGDRRRRLAESKISMETAEAACRKALTRPLDIKDCVYDIIATQDLDMVGAF